MSNISEILEKYKDSQTLENKICESFFEQARRFANSRIATDFQQAVSGTDIANSAMRDALKNVANGEIRNANSAEFKRILFRIVRNKVVDEVRHQQSQKVPPPAVSHDPDLESGDVATDPVVEKAVGEFSTNAALAMMRRHEGEDKHPMRIYIAALGALYDLTATNIHDTLKKQFPSEEIPNFHSIRRQKTQDTKFIIDFVRQQLKAEDQKDD